LVEERRQGAIGDTILLLEHEPVYTIGRTRDRSSLRDAGEHGLPVVEINRGGQATYHGPGQLVGYPILDLNDYGHDLHIYSRALEEALIEACGAAGITAGRREGLTGVWVEDRKIASIGVGCATGSACTDSRSTCPLISADLPRLFRAGFRGDDDFR